MYCLHLFYQLLPDFTIKQISFNNPCLSYIQTYLLPFVAKWNVLDDTKYVGYHSVSPWNSTHKVNMWLKYLWIRSPTCRSASEPFYLFIKDLHIRTFLPFSLRDVDFDSLFKFFVSTNVLTVEFNVTVVVPHLLTVTIFINHFKRWHFNCV